MHAWSVHPRSAELGQQRGMHVEHAPAERRGHLGRHEAHVSRQRDELHAVVGERAGEFRTVGRVRRPEHDARDPGALGAREGARVGPVRRDEHDVTAASVTARGEMVEDGLEIGAAAAGEHADPGARHDVRAR